MTRTGKWLLATLWLLSSLGNPLTTFAANETGLPGWKLYTNARFGFSIRYPPNWRLGDPLPDGVGIVLYPPVEGCQVTLSGFMNLVKGTSQDGRQTLQEYATAHRRIIGEIYEKRNQTTTWQDTQDMTLAKYPAKRLTFIYHNDRGQPIQEIHIFSLGRNEGRGVRIKLSSGAQKTVMPVINRMLGTFEPGRDQNAVSPLVPKEQN